MATCHYKLLPPSSDGNFDETMRYACQESPCIDNDVAITALSIDTHAGVFHNADWIEVDTSGGYSVGSRI